MVLLKRVRGAVGGNDDVVNGLSRQHLPISNIKPAADETHNELAAAVGQSVNSSNTARQAQDPSKFTSPAFRVIALPQVAYGDGAPFLRGYSDELNRYSISRDEFIRIVDSVNVAIVPNPENQVFQKAARIAGIAAPPAAGLALIAGRVGAGAGASIGHKAAVAKVLSHANLTTFLPVGLEMCIGHTGDVDHEVGISSDHGLHQSQYGSSPEDRLASYGDSIASISKVLSPPHEAGRSDPIAAAGNRISERKNNKQQRRAEHCHGKGKDKKANELESKIQWLFVRQATQDARLHWDNAKQEMDTVSQ